MRGGSTTKTLIKIASWAAVIAVFFALPFVVTRLPLSTGEKIRDAHDSWAGVLRVWACPGFSPGSGSFTPWLNQRISRFESKNKGVYVQIIHVSPETLRQFAVGETNPPDAILFSPGMLGGADALMPLSEPNLLSGLASSGMIGNTMFACPVAMGGYAWVYNRSYLSEIPADFRDLPALAPPAKGRDAPFYVNCAADSPYMSWSGALLSLMADRVERPLGEPKEAPRAGEGIDLGLPVKSAAPDQPSSEGAVTVACYLPEELPESFRQRSSVYSDFVNGRAAAIPATQLEIRRLAQLSDSGRAPDYQVEVTGDHFTDQLLMYSIVDYPREDLAKRQALLEKLLEFLLSEDSQRGLQSIYALPVIDTAPIYAGQFGMAELEAAMTAAVKTTGAFDEKFRGRLKERADGRFTKQ